MKLCRVRHGHMVVAVHVGVFTWDDARAHLWAGRERGWVRFAGCSDDARFAGVLFRWDAVGSYQEWHELACIGLKHYGVGVGAGGYGSLLVRVVDPPMVSREQVAAAAEGRVPEVEYRDSVLNGAWISC